MGDWLWKIYKDGNMDVPALEDHDSRIAGQTALSESCKDSLKGNGTKFHNSKFSIFYLREIWIANVELNSVLYFFFLFHSQMFY